jgi:hypothetical protein
MTVISFNDKLVAKKKHQVRTLKARIEVRSGSNLSPNLVRLFNKKRMKTSLRWFMGLWVYGSKYVHPHLHSVCVRSMTEKSRS